MQNKLEKKTGFGLKEIICVILITSIITSLTTGVIVYNQNRLTKNITFQDLSKDNSLKEFLKVYASLIDEYYEDVDKTAMLEKAIEAMLKYLGEDYSMYMNKTETDNLEEQLKGEYQGIGINISKKDNSITGFIEGGSAKDSGLMIGDKIIAVNNQAITSSNEISSIIQTTKEGEKIEITIDRNGTTLSFQTESRKLYVPAIEYGIKEEDIGYIKMITFSNTLAKQVNMALKTLEEEGMKSLIIDLRDNTGGYLSEAKTIASMFLEKGSIIYSLEDKDAKEDFKDETEEKRNYKVIILVNENSASASEVLVAALKENYGAIIVGEKTYGKGKVQQTRTLEDGSMVKYTSAKWLTPNGECIDGEGIEPDYQVTNTEDNDEQLEKAIELAE